MQRLSERPVSLLPKGLAFARMTKMIVKHGSERLSNAAEYADFVYRDTPEVGRILKAAVSAGTTTSDGWNNLVDYPVLLREFMDVVRPLTIVGRMPNMRRVPVQVKVPSATASSLGAWLGQGVPIPLGRMTLETKTVPRTHAGSMIAFTDDLVEAVGPEAEAAFQRTLADGVAAFMNQQFIDPAVSAVANTTPAAITNGVTPIVMAGTNALAVDEAVRAAFSAAFAGGVTYKNGVWIMKPRAALALAGLGFGGFGGISIKGGTFYGLPVIVSDHVPFVPGSPTSNSSYIVLADESEILYSFESMRVDSSGVAAVQFESAPTNNSATPTPTNVISAFQTSTRLVRVIQTTSWLRRKDEAVQLIETPATF